jgi:hypothetical protein
MTRTLVVGDIHGAARALRQALDRAEFDPAADHLICLGDICDRGPEVDLAIYSPFQRDPVGGKWRALLCLAGRIRTASPVGSVAIGRRT